MTSAHAHDTPFGLRKHKVFYTAKFLLCASGLNYGSTDNQNNINEEVCIPEQ